MSNVNWKEKIDSWLEQDYRETFMERIDRILEAEVLFRHEEGAVQYAHTLDYILSGISVLIKEDEHITGSVKTRIPTDEEVASITEIYKKWWDIPIEERHKKILFYYSEGWLKCRPYWFASFGHLAMDWETILNKGLPWMLRKAEDKLTESCTSNQINFLNGVTISYNAILNFIGRYENAADTLVLKNLSKNLGQIKKGPAQTFEQALQLIWLLTLIMQKVCGCGVLNFSRMDQYLYDYYQRDLNNGILTEENALELLREFYFKNNEIMVQTDHMSQETKTTSYTLEVAYDDPNYIILGGRNADHTSGVNELSFLMVRAARDLKLRNPFIVIRYHTGISKSFWRLCCDAMRENTTLVIYNDETMIPALKLWGVEEPEVYDYGFFGCNDPNIPAYEGGLRQVWFNLVKPLELALHQGDYPLEPREPHSPKRCQFDMEDRLIGLMTGAYYGIEGKKLSHIHTMEDFLNVYEEQLTYLVSEYRKGFEQDFVIEQKCAANRMRIEDCFLKDTIENKITWTEGGTKYHKIVAQGSGVATLINCLYAIEQLVFVKQEMTLEELATIMRTDYEGCETLAKKFKKKIDKFGNDVDEVDKYAPIVTDIYTRALKKANGPQHLYQLWPTFSTDRDFTTMGLFVGATPDGRRAKEPLSENQSPAEGSDVSGITAMLNSISKLSFDKITGGPLNLRLHPSAVSGDEGLDAMTALFQTYMENGGIQIQVNVVDAETLKQAQLTPEKYKTLCVRVTGYSAFFVEMGEQAQNEMIRRTEQLV